MKSKTITSTEPNIKTLSVPLTAVKPQNGSFLAAPLCKAGNQDVHVSLDRLASSDDMELLLRVEDKKTSTNGIFSINLTDVLLALAADFTRQVQALDKKTDTSLDDQAQADLAKKQYKEASKIANFKDFYDINCPYCKHEQMTAPSAFHRLGIYDLGKGCCKKCGEWMDVIYQPQTDSMMTRQPQASDYHQGD